MSKRWFDPWVGPNYQDGVAGVRVLLLGESHWGKPEDNRRSFTQDTVKWFSEGGNRYAYFSKIPALFLHEVKGTRVSREELTDFYSRVVFYNYVQELLDASRKAPTAHQWRAAQEPLLEVLREQKPHLVVILGRRLAGYAEEVVNSAGFAHCTLPHPSSSAIRFDRHRAKLMQSMQGARSAAP